METKNGSILSINISETRGEKKHEVPEAYLEANWGIREDAHSGEWHRQISLLSLSSIEKMRALGVEVDYGAFAENLTIDGFDVYTLPVGTKLNAGDALLEVTQIGKECHKGCAIKQQVGICVMPLEGVFARVLSPGWVRPGDQVEVIPG